jgi:hypothetical protein
MLTLLKIYLAGMAVLVAAIGLNLLANLLGLSTWYDFLGTVSQQGLMAALRRLSVLDYLFLIVLYPFLLGLAAYLPFSIAALAGR